MCKEDAQRTKQDEKVMTNLAWSVWVIDPEDGCVDHSDGKDKVLVCVVECTWMEVEAQAEKSTNIVGRSVHDTEPCDDSVNHTAWTGYTLGYAKNLCRCMTYIKYWHTMK
jgi:hypothetical protein